MNFVRGALVVLLSASLFLVASISRVNASVSAIQWLSNSTTGSYPTAVSFDSSGNIYVANYYGSNVQKFNNTGGLVSSFGSYGSNDGQFVYPSGITVDSSGNIYVADEGSSRIQKFDSAFVWQWSFGTYGSGDGQFNGLQGIVVDSSNGRIYVADRGNSRIQVISTDGAFISTFPDTIEGHLEWPNAVAIDAGGNVYVTDILGKRVKKFTSAGTFISTFGEAGTELGQFSQPRGIAVDGSGNIYVVDDTQNRVQKFNSSYQILPPFGSTGSGNGQFSGPGGIGVSSSGIVVVADTTNSRIQRFDYSGSDYQVGNLSSSLELINTVNKLSVEAGGFFGINNATASLRLKTNTGLTISDVTVNMTTDRDWSNVTGASDRASAKSVVSNLIGAPGASATHTLYVPLPEGRTSPTVFICPSATTLNDVNGSCAGGVQRSVGSYTESFGNIVISLVSNIDPNVEYFKITGMTGSGGFADQIINYSGSGTGTVSDPYQVSTCSQLQELTYIRAASYVLVNDIDCSDTLNWNTGSGFLPIGSDASHPFTGQLDGQNHTISGLFISKDTDYLGLFGYTNNATISNLSVMGMDYYIDGPSAKGWDTASYTGALIGYMAGGTVNNVIAVGGISQIYDDTAPAVGGLIGQTEGDAHITNCESAVNITLSNTNGVDGIGGFVGVTAGTTLIEDSSATGNVTTPVSSYSVGGFIGWQGGHTIINRCTSEGTVHVGVGGDPVNGDGNSYDVGGFAGAVGNYHDDIGTTEINYSSSSSLVIEDGSYNYEVGGFAGGLYDGGKIIWSYSTGDVNATWSDTWSYGVGGFVGYTRNRWGEADPVISYCYATGDVNAAVGHDQVGGFIGEHRNGTIEYSYATGNVNVGTAGSDDLWVDVIGGFFGIARTGTQITNSFSKGNVDTIGWGSEIGGFGGGLEGTGIVSNSASLGSFVNGTSDVGGFIGDIGGTSQVLNSYTRTNVISRYMDPTDPLGDSANIGGFTASASGTILNSYSTGSISGITNPADTVNTVLSADLAWDATTMTVADASGIPVGSYLWIDKPPTASSTLTDAALPGNTTITVADATGFAQWDDILIDPGNSGLQEQTYITSINGNILGVGGITNTHLPMATVSTIPNTWSYTTEIVEVTNVAGNVLTISRAYGNTSANDFTAGTTIKNVVLPNTLDFVTTGAFLGDLAGGTITDSYWDADTSSAYRSAAGTGLTTTEMHDTANFSNWDFDTIWGMSSLINENYPFLWFDDPTFTGFGLSNGGNTLSPSFSRFTTDYIADGTAEVSFNLGMTQTLFSSVLLNGEDISSLVRSNTATQAYPLTSGENLFSFVSTSYDGNVIEYNLTIGGSGSIPVELKELKLESSDYELELGQKANLTVSIFDVLNEVTDQYNGEVLLLIDTVNGDLAVDSIQYQLGTPAIANIPEGVYFTQAGTYTVTAYDPLNDLLLDTISITVLPAKVPVLTLLSNTKSITVGDSATLTWVDEFVSNLLLSYDGVTKSLEGLTKLKVSPLQTTEYTLTGKGVNGEDMVSKVTITVVPKSTATIIPEEETPPTEDVPPVEEEEEEIPVIFPEEKPKVEQKDPEVKAVPVENTFHIEPSGIGLLALVVFEVFGFTVLPLQGIAPMFGNLWYAFLGLIESKNRKKPWGIVYDSVSKEVLGRSIVRVYDILTGKLLQTVVSQVNGMFNISLGSGRYRLEVLKPGYIFPSNIVAGKDDGGYPNIYRGGLLEVKSDKEVVMVSVPLDSEKANGVKKVGVSFGTRFYLFLSVIVNAGFVFGFIYTVYATYQSNILYNWIICILYGLVILVKLAVLLFKPRSFGTLKINGDLRSDVEIMLYETEFNTLSSKTKTDSKGRYNFLVENKDYNVKVLVDGKEYQDFDAKDKDEKKILRLITKDFSF